MTVISVRYRYIVCLMTMVYKELDIHCVQKKHPLTFSSISP